MKNKRGTRLRKFVAGLTGLALAVGIGATVQSANAALIPCTVNFVIQQDLTFSFSPQNKEDTKAQLVAAVSSFEDLGIPVKAGASSFGIWAPLEAAPRMLNQDINSAAGNLALRNKISSYEFDNGSNATNWEWGLEEAFSNAKSQGAKNIVFVTDGVPNTYNNGSGGWVNNGTAYDPVAGARAKVVADKIRAAGITLSIAFVRTDQPYLHGLDDPYSPTPTATVLSAMNNLEAGWTIDKALPIDVLARNVRDNTMATCTSSMTLQKSHIASDVVDKNGNGITDTGDTVAFSFKVTNTGTMPLRNLTISDPKLEAVGVTLANGGKIPTIAVNGSTIIKSNPYTLTLADTNAGKFVNSASITGTTPNKTVTTTDVDTVPITQTPAVALVKSHAAADVVDKNGNGKTDAGDTVAFTFTATNTGNVTLDNIVVTDPKLAAAGVTLVNGGKIANLAPGAKGAVKSNPYTVTQADVEAGKFDNTATVSADSPLNVKVTATDTDTLAADQAPAVTLSTTHAGTDVIDKNGNGKTDAGDTVVFTYTATNSGNLALSGVKVTDAKLAAAGVTLVNGGAVANLAPGATGTVKSNPYTIKQADVEAGSFVTTGSVTGTSVKGNVTGSNSDTVPLTQVAAVGLATTHVAADVLDKNGNGRTDAGDTAVFTYTATNTGTVSLTTPTVTDAKLAAAGVILVNAGKLPTLAPGASASIKSNPYTIKQADVEAGSFTVTGSVTGTSVKGNATASDSDTLPVTQAAGIGLTATHAAADVLDKNGNGRTDAGDTVVFTYTVSNTGTLGMTGIKVTDSKLAAVGVTLVNGGAVANLAPGATGTVKSNPYTIKQSDVEAGSFDVAASATGTTVKGAVSTSDVDSVPMTQTPAIALSTTHVAGDLLDKNGNGKVDAGDTIVFTYTATNTGTLGLTGVKVTDAKLAAAGVTLLNSGVVANLAPGASGSVKSNPYTIKQADVEAGSFTATGSVVGTSVKGNATATNSDTVAMTQAPAISLSATHAGIDVVDTNKNGKTDVGDTVAFTYTATNTGNLGLTGVKVTDAKLAAAGVTLVNGGAIGNLAPGAVGSVKSNPYTLTQADMEVGTFVTTGSVAGTSVKGNVTASDTDSVTLARAPGVSLAMSHAAADVIDTNGNGKTDAGDTIVFNYTVTNTGNLGLSSVKVSDAALAASGVSLVNGGAVANLAPGATGTVKSNPYTIKQADVEVGWFTATGSVWAASATGSVTATNTNTISLSRTPAVVLSTIHAAADVVDKNGNGKTDAGDTVVFTYIATNTGTLGLSSIKVTDAKLAAAGVSLVNGGAIANLAPGASGSVKSNPYTLTQADVEAGSFTVTGAVSAASATGNVTATNSDTLVLTQAPAVSLSAAHSAADVVDKNGNGLVDAGDTVVFTYTVTNTGTVNLTAPTVTDAKLAAAGVTLVNAGKLGNLAPGASATIKSNPYTIKQADVEAGAFSITGSVVAGSVKGNVMATAADTLPMDQRAVIALVKSHVVSDIVDKNGNGLLDAGDTVVFTYTATNTGTLGLTNVTVSDAVLAAAGIKIANGGALGSLAVGASGTIKSLPYTLIQADVEAGKFTSTGSVVGTSVKGNATATSTSSINTDQRATASMVKSHSAADLVDVNGDSRTDPGDTVVFTYVVTNTGTVMLSNVTVSDAVLAAAGVKIVNDGRIGTLGIGASATIKSQPYTLTRADATAGKFTSTGSVTATSVKGTITASAASSVPVLQLPQFNVVFDGNAQMGVVTGSTASILVEYGCTTCLLPANGFSKTTGAPELIDHSTETAEVKSTFLGWSLDRASRTGDIADRAVAGNLSRTDGATVRLYAIWDDAPRFIVASYPDRFFTLEQAKAGNITEAELLLTVKATDKETNPLVHKTKALVQSSGNDVGVTMFDYDPTDYTSLTGSGVVTATYKVKDGVGHVAFLRIRVTVSDGAPMAQDPATYLRGISPEFAAKGSNNGGLPADSLWKTDPTRKAALDRALSGASSTTYCLGTDAVTSLRDRLRDPAGGIGNSKTPDGLAASAGILRGSGACR